MSSSVFPLLLVAVCYVCTAIVYAYINTAVIIYIYIRLLRFARELVMELVCKKSSCAPPFPQETGAPAIPARTE